MPGRTAIEWGVLIVVALLIAIVIRTFVFQAFYIPSESMVPTLKIGDRVLVNKLSYKLHDPRRGDIAVFKAPAAARTEEIKDLVKRDRRPARRDDRGQGRPHLHRRACAVRAVLAGRDAVAHLPRGEGPTQTRTSCWATTVSTRRTPRSSGRSNGTT